MLCWFLQGKSAIIIYTYHLPIEPHSSPSSHPSSVSENTKLTPPVQHGSFPLAIYFTHGSAYISVLLSQFVPPSLSPAVSTSPKRIFFSTLLTQVYLVKVMCFSVVMYGYESWTIRKLSAIELMLLNCGVGGEDS